MLLTLFVIVLITLGGTALTYLYEKQDVLLARLAAGSVVGSTVFGTVGFALASLFGLSAPVVVAALVAAAAPLALLARREVKKEFRRDWDRAKSRLQGANVARFARFVYYLGLLIVLWFFFERAMIVTEQGVFTGGANNLGDLPFHLGAIYSFTDGQNFPPQNPSYAFAKFTYPFLVDFITACFMKLGAAVRDAMLVQNVALAFALAVLLEKFTVRLVGDRRAGKIAPVLLFLSGGLGFLWFFRDAFHTSAGFFDFLWRMPNDYTINEIVSTKGGAPEDVENLRWGNSLTTLFLTQRSLLLGLPLALIALMKIWDIFTAGREAEDEAKPIEEKNKRAHKAAQDKQTISPSPSLPISPSPFLPFSFSPLLPIFLTGLLAGTLPLIHVHSLAVLFVVCAFLFFFRTAEKWREWLAFAAGVAVIAVPELVFAMTGSASNLREFIGWHWGWDAGEQNIFVFWAKNIGFFIPLLVAGLYLIWHDRNRAPEEKASAKRKTENRKPKTENLLLFYLPFAFLFLVSNTVKLAPWEWDNIKVLIYWFVASVPFVAYLLARLWEKSGPFKAAAAAALVLLTLSGALDVWRTVSRQIRTEVFSRDAVRFAEQVKSKTAPRALLLNAPTYNSAAVLTGRPSLMRYTGHLSSYGIAYRPREAEVKKIYEGGPEALGLLRKNRVEYVIISPEERANLTVNEQFFTRFPVVAAYGDYRLYEVRF